MIVAESWADTGQLIYAAALNGSQWKLPALPEESHYESVGDYFFRYPPRPFRTSQAR